MYRTLASWMDIKKNLIWVFINLNKTLETNEKLQKNQRVVNTKLLISHLLITLEYFTFVKVMLRHSTLTMWLDMK